MTVVNAFLDARCNACYTESNVEQDHYFDGDDCRALYCAGGSRLEIVHYLQRASTTSVQAGLLR
jgi:hypothetical protein